jgi:hypothetical protein
MWITESAIPSEETEKAAQIHYLDGRRPETEPNDDTMKTSARSMGIGIIGKKHLRHMSPRLLFKAFSV